MMTASTDENERVCPMKKGLFASLLLLILCTGAVLFFQSLNKSAQTITTEDYKIDGCTEEKQRDLFSLCTDYEKLVEQERLKAKKAGKIFVIKFGYFECPWCLAMHKLFHTKDLERGQKIQQLIADDFHIVEVSIRSESGKKVRDHYQMNSRTEGVPFLMAFNPMGETSCEDTFAGIDTGDLEIKKDSDGLMHDPSKVLTALEQAKVTLKTSPKTGPCEPAVDKDNHETNS
jgi:thioredoxin-related protein